LYALLPGLLSEVLLDAEIMPESAVRCVPKYEVQICPFFALVQVFLKDEVQVDFYGYSSW